MKEVIFKRLAIVNFLSVGEEPVVIEFTKGLHVITGNNKDKPDRQNGIGKSTIADALYFAIFGETLRNLKKDLIPNNLVNGRTQVELDFEVITSTASNSYSVIRTLGPSKVIIYKNGIDKTRDSIANTTKYICDVLSASPAIFQNCVIMTINNAVPFMAKNKTEKRKFIEDIFGMEVFSTMLSDLRSEYNEVKRSYDIICTKLEEVKLSYDNYLKQKNNLIEKRKEKEGLYLKRQSDNNIEREKLTAELKLIEYDSIDNIKSKILEYSKKLNKCDEKINTIISDISTNKSEVLQNKDRFKKIGTEEETCPVCLRSIKDHDQALIESEKTKIKDNIINIADRIKNLDNDLLSLKTLKDKINSIITGLNNKIAETKMLQEKEKSYTERLLQIDRWQEELAKDLEIVKESTTEFDEIINTTKQRLNEHNKEVNEFKKTLSKLDIVKYIVSEEGVKAHIVTKLLELLNGKLLSYLKKLDSNCICIFNEFFEEEILNEKNKVCSYFNFSGAERKAIDLACLFTFSDIRRLQGGVKYNIAIYDELFDSSFDEKGIELVTKILQDRVDEQHECALVISHRKESIKAVTGSVIFLEKENGITRRVEFKEM